MCVCVCVCNNIIYTCMCVNMINIYVSSSIENIVSSICVNKYLVLVWGFSL